MVYAQVRHFVGQVETEIMRPWRRRVPRNDISKASLHKSDTVSPTKASTSLTHRGPPMPPLVVTSRNTMEQMLRRALKTTTVAEEPTEKRSIRSLLKSLGLDVSNKNLFPTSFWKGKNTISTSPNDPDSRHSGPSNS